MLRIGASNLGVIVGINDDTSLLHEPVRSHATGRFDVPHELLLVALQQNMVGQLNLKILICTYTSERLKQLLALLVS